MKKTAILKSLLNTNSINMTTQMAGYIIVRVGDQPLFYRVNNIIDSAQSTFGDIEFCYLKLFLDMSLNIITRYSTELTTGINLFFPSLSSVELSDAPFSF